MTPLRRQRLLLASLVLVAAAVATGLIVLALQQNMSYLHTPSQVLEGEVPTGARFRLGGVVCEGSVHRQPGALPVQFRVTDRAGFVTVRYAGILPDLFREGQSVIATGRMHEGVFEAQQVLAKHDETYMPPEVEAAMRTARATDSPDAGCGAAAT